MRDLSKPLIPLNGCKINKKAQTCQIFTAFLLPEVSVNKVTDRKCHYKLNSDNL